MRGSDGSCALLFVLNLKGANIDYTTIKSVFTRNIPTNVQDIVTEVQQLQGIVSKRTLLAQLPFIEDVDAELEEVEKEESTFDMSNFGQDDSLIKDEVPEVDEE